MNAKKMNINLRWCGRSLVRATLVSMLTWVWGPIPAAAQNTGNPPPNPSIVYVTNTDGGISEINPTNNSVIATAPFGGIGAAAAVTPDGRRIYVTDYLSANVTVFDAATNVPLAQIPVGSGTGNIGVAVTPDGSAVYVTSQFDGIATVIATASNSVVKTIATGAEPVWVTISPNGSRAYVSNQASGTVSVIATASNNVIATIGGFSCPSHSRLIHFASELLVSSACDNALKIVSTASNTVINSVPTGLTPSGIGVTADETRAYVADFFGNTVDVIDLNSMTNLGTPIAVGTNPRGVAIAPNGQLYVANFGDTTVSVIDTSTNQVTATLNVRPGPADVTVSTTARPHILNYSFQAFDPPGSVDTVPHAINSSSQSVGRFQDAAGVVHGYLRQPDGSFATIDPPGSTFTTAFGINDAGTIVGIWQAASGAFHGFTRNPSGSYTVTDFPGAVDSEFTSVNSQGILLGDYDLGDTSTSIAFLDTRSLFTSFEDPAAAPAQTLALSINSQSFVTGYFDDPAGNEHGFVRSPNAQFNNFDFPVADFTDALGINDLGQVVGQYSTNFPTHAFVLSGATSLTGLPSPCQFLSFDYPDSQNSGARGINNAGQITGIFRLRGNPARHGFLATPSAGANVAPNIPCLATTGGAANRHADFKSFDFPGATNTQATAITPSGLIVGRYNSPDGIQHGFTLLNGSYSSVDGPGATFTDVAWANARGDLVGSFNDSRGSHAYVLSGGTFKTFDSPIPALPFIAGFGLSNGGDVVGVLFGENFFQGRGYIFSNNAFTFIDVPGATGTFPTMALDPTRIVGTYVESSNQFHGFSLANGKFTTVDVPNATFTWITGINPEGDLVGFYFDQGGNQHGFVQRDSSFIIVEVPVPGANSSEGNGIDPQTDIVGRYNSADGKAHGFFLRCVACSYHDSTGLLSATR